MQKIIELTNELLKASSAYYNTGTSHLTDKEFDEKLQQLKVMEDNHHFRLSNSPTINVGAPVLDELRKVTVGNRPMLSLDKCRMAEDIIKFAKGKSMVASIKADGLSVRLTYHAGQLISAVTRGNGYEGTNVTNHVKQFLNIPLIIDAEDLIVDGEAVIKAEDFAIVNKEGTFKNPRNTAAGALNLLDMKEVKARRLSFIAWDLIEGRDEQYFYDRMMILQDMGFEIIPMCLLSANSMKDAEYIEANNIELLIDANEYGIPCDGVVWKFNDLAYGESLGRTEKFFRNAIAYKPEDEEAETILRDIEFTMGRSGILTPVAIYDDVELLGSVCNRASLHNLDVMTETLGKKPWRGQKITIIKSQQIIPMVVEAERMIDNDESNLDVINLPSSCPFCGHGVTIQATELTHNLVCTNPACEGKFNNIVNHYCGKKGLDIKHISGKIIGQLMDFGWLNELSDLYTLDKYKNEWIKKTGWGLKSVERILNSIESSKNCKLENFLSALGIPQCGPAQTKEIVKVCPTYKEFREKVDDKWDFTQVNGIGGERWHNIIYFDYTQADKIAELLSFEETQKEIETEVKETSISGKVFVITGKMSAPFKKRDELVSFIEEHGGKVSSAVSSKTNYLINNDNTSTTAKNKKAAELGIPVITVDEFMQLVE